MEVRRDKQKQWIKVTEKEGRCWKLSSKKRRIYECHTHTCLVYYIKYKGKLAVKVSLIPIYGCSCYGIILFPYTSNTFFSGILWFNYNDYLLLFHHQLHLHACCGQLSIGWDYFAFLIMGMGLVVYWIEEI